MNTLRALAIAAALMFVGMSHARAEPRMFAVHPEGWATRPPKTTCLPHDSFPKNALLIRNWQAGTLQVLVAELQLTTGPDGTEYMVLDVDNLTHSTDADSLGHYSMTNFTADVYSVSEVYCQ